MTVRPAAPVRESHIQRQVMAYLERRGWLIVRLNVDRRRAGVRGLAPGTPDLLCHKAGHPALYVEVKRPGEAPRPAQVGMMQALREHGAVCIVATSVEDVQREGL